MLNQVVLVGRLTADPEMVNTDSGKQKTLVIEIIKILKEYMKLILLDVLYGMV